jgi:hypothetical protein
MYTQLAYVEWSTGLGVERLSYFYGTSREYVVLRPSAFNTMSWLIHLSPIEGTIYFQIVG